jgi:hypothetical protein
MQLQLNVVDLSMSCALQMMWIEGSTFHSVFENCN